MRRLRRILRAFRDRCDGISVTEYGLLIAVVAVLLLAVVRNAGASLGTMFQRATCAITAYGSDQKGNNGGDNNTGESNNGGDNNTGGGC